MLLLVSLAVCWHASGVGKCGGDGGSAGGAGEGGLSFHIPWMGSRRMTKGVVDHIASTSMTAAGTIEDDGNVNMVVASVQQCGILLKESEEGCLRRFNTVAASSSSSSSSSSMGRGEKEAWREVRDGLEGVWRGLIESECKCHNPEMLDRMYEGLRERAGEMAGGSAERREVLEG